MERLRELATAPVGKLLLRYSTPAIIGTVVTALYNIIDSVVIGHAIDDPNVVSGIAVTFPVMNLATALGMLIGTGAATRISIVMGQNDKKQAELILGNSILLTLIIGALYMSAFAIWIDPLLHLFGASANSLPYAREFLLWVLPGMVLINVTFSYNNVMRATGYPKKAMFSAMLTVGCNIILAPVCIFVLEWGIRGAAISTIISQFAGMIWVLSHFVNKKSYIRFKRVSLRLRPRIIRNIFSIGMSPFIMNVCACCIVIFINNRLLNYGGDLAIGAFGILNRIQMLFVMIVMGITMGMQPISGYNYGAGNIDRVKRTLKLGIVAATCITTFGFLISELFPGLFVGMFTNNEELTHQATIALQIGVAVFPIIGSQIIITQFFQSIGKAAISIFLSLSRQLLFLLPGLALLPPIYGVKGVWFSMPISDFLAALAAIGMLLYQLRKMKLENLRGV